MILNQESRRSEPAPYGVRTSRTNIHPAGHPRAYGTAARLLRPTQRQRKPAEPAMPFITSGEASQEAEPEDAIPGRPEPAARAMLFSHPYGPAERGARHHPRCGLRYVATRTVRGLSLRASPLGCEQPRPRCGLPDNQRSPGKQALRACASAPAVFTANNLSAVNNVIYYFRPKLLNDIADGEGPSAIIEASGMLYIKI